MPGGGDVGLTAKKPKPLINIHIHTPNHQNHRKNNNNNNSNIIKRETTTTKTNNNNGIIFDDDEINEAREEALRIAATISSSSSSSPPPSSWVGGEAKSSLSTSDNGQETSPLTTTTETTNNRPSLIKSSLPPSPSSSSHDATSPSKRKLLQKLKKSTLSPSSSISPHKSITKKLKNRNSNKPTITDLTKAQNIVKDAWLCGLCGAIFQSFALATSHEMNCVRLAFSREDDDGGSGTSSTIGGGAGCCGGNGERLLSLRRYAARARRDQEAEESRGQHPAVGDQTTTTTTGLQRQSSLRRMVAIKEEPSFTDDSLATTTQHEPRSTTTFTKSSPSDKNLSSSASSSSIASTSISQRPPLIASPSSIITTDHPIPSKKRIASIDTTRSPPITPPATPTTPAPKPPPSPCTTTTKSLNISPSLLDNILLTDDALVKIIHLSTRYALSRRETDAECDLEHLIRDGAYYERDAYGGVDGIWRRMKVQLGALTMGGNGTDNDSKNDNNDDDDGSRHSSSGGFFNTIKRRFVEAYALIKEGEGDDGVVTKDRYATKVLLRTNRRGGKGGGGGGADDEFSHDRSTIYVNVVVKNSFRVVNNELKRLARLRWDDFELAKSSSSSSSSNNNNNNSKRNNEQQRNQFERFRTIAQWRAVQLAGFALAQDFTPRRIAIQLSNDLYRNLVPELENRGVTIETEIEYRHLAFFVLAVNVKKIDWRRFIAHTHRDVVKRQTKTTTRTNTANNESEDEANSSSSNNNKTGDDSRKSGLIDHLKNFSFKDVYIPSKLEVLAQVLSLFYHVHWLVFVPICRIFYIFHKQLINTYVLISVTDDIFRYVEKKGMEMSINIQTAQNQTPLMLAVLREQRADEKKRQKQQERQQQSSSSTTTDVVEGIVLGPLLGDRIKEDEKEAVEPPSDDFTLPEPLEFEGIDITLPVGFRRLRWALLSRESRFMAEAVWEADAKYQNIVSGEWSRHGDVIGSPHPPDTIDVQEFVGVECENSYLMPKSAFVKANTAYETVTITHYSDRCFCVKRRTRTPEVPFGESFIAWTQMVVVNSGRGSCRMICSIEAEFPNGQPMVARQIKSGMRTGVTEFFTLFSSAIIRYANKYP